MFSKEITILDGAMGTMLQREGLKLGDRPETLSITAPDVVEDIHRQYVHAGTQLLLTNTFCANAHKLAGTGYSVEEVVTASVVVAKRACEGTACRVALDIGPIGELLEPLAACELPLLLIHGTGDSEVPAWHSEDLAAAGKDAQLLFAEGAGHGMARYALGEAFYDALTEFYAQAGAI